MNFSMEEMNLICVYNATTRPSLIREIQHGLPDTADDELREIMVQVLSKLERLTDEEFSAINFYADYDEDNEEQEG